MHQYAYFHSYICEATSFRKESLIHTKCWRSDFSLGKKFLSETEINDIRKDLNVKPYVNGDYGAQEEPFKIYLENAMENENWGNHRYDQLKPIIKYSPNVYYNPAENYFEFNVEVRDNIQMTSYQTVKYVDPPLQKWLSFIVVYTSNRILVYVNQKLVISKRLKNPPIFKPDNIKIGEANNNIKGTLGKVVYWGYPLDISEIQKATFELEY